MTRTIINIDPEDKAWLDREAQSLHVPMTEVVRRAISAYRLRQESQGASDFQKLLQRTSGIWKAGDGLAYQQRLRDEWTSED